MQFVCIMTVLGNCCMLFELYSYCGLCTHILRTGNTYSLVFLALTMGQIELTRVQNGSVGFEKKKIYIYIYIYIYILYIYIYIYIYTHTHTHTHFPPLSLGFFYLLVFNTVTKNKCILR